MKQLIIILFFISSLSFGQNIFISTGSGTLYKTNPNTCTSTLIGSCPTFVDIAFLPNGKLYGQTWGAIYEVDTLTAATTLVMTVPSGNSLVGGPNGKLYAVSGTTLREIDPVAGTSVILGTVNCGSGGDLAFFNGILHLACGGNNLLQIDISNPGASFVVGNMSISGAAWGLVNNVNGCTENPFVISSSGLLYNLDYTTAGTTGGCNMGITGSVYGAAAPNEFLASGGVVNILGADTTICNTPSYTMTVPPAPNTTILWSNATTSNSLTVNSTGQYWVQITDTAQGCVISDTINITFNNFTVNDTIIEICLTGDIDLQAEVNPPTGSTWYDNTFTPLGGFPLTLNNIGSYTYYYATSGTCADTAMVTVNVLYDSIDLGNDTIFCDGGNATYGVNLAGFTYLWSNGATTNSTSFTTSGTYYLDATSIAHGCVLSDTVNVLVLPVPDAGLEGSVTMCDYTGVDLYNWLNGSPVTGGTWLDPSNTPVSMPFSIASPADGAYKYVVTNGVCSDSSFVNLTNIFPDLSGFTYGPDRIIVDQTPVTFTRLSSADHALWTVNGIIRNNLPTITEIFPNEGLQEVCLVLTTDNCIDTLCNDIPVIEDIGVFVPNAFTPDNDGHNDNFTPSITGDIENYHFYIFNRWGNLIYETEDTDGAWDGKHKGNLCPNDSYVWRVTYEIPGTIEKKSVVGHINLIK